MRAYLAELMHPGKSAQDCVILYYNVPRELGVVGENGVIADLAIVRQMHVGHNPVMVAQPRNTDILRVPRLKVQNSTDNIVVSDL